HGCDHEWKRAFCTGHETCPLFKKEMETLEALRLLAEEPIYERFLENIDKTLKADVTSKKLVLLTALSAYSDNPLNLYMKGPPSIGKTACTVAVTNYFPKEDVWSLGGMTPKALIHQKGYYDKEAGRHVIELWNKILLFLDAPDLKTLDMLKPILSHDMTEIEYRWTDPEKLKTKKVFIRGWPAVIFCTTQTQLLQEIASRGMTATPEINEAKFKAVIEFKGDRLVQPWKYHEVDEEKEMIGRALACLKSPSTSPVRHTHVVIPYAKKLSRKFPHREAQYLREFDKYCSLIGTHAFLHQYQRFIREEVVDGKPTEYVIADPRDYEEGTALYSEIREATLAGVPSHVIEFFDKVVSCLTGGATYEDLRKRYFEVYHKSLGKSTLSSYLSPLEDLGWISIETHPEDRRRRLVTVEGKPDIASQFRFEKFSELFGPEDLKEWLGESARIVRKGPMGRNIVEGEDLLMNYWTISDAEDLEPVRKMDAENIASCKSEANKRSDPKNWLEKR
ncbi:MAG: hypothetical protein OEZ48_03750, partial [Candidatus Bathyarchaeota archaeon]|nr:hypothetical protein [Candidatus Bathyarchaeota archaeon]